MPALTCLFLPQGLPSRHLQADGSADARLHVLESMSTGMQRAGRNAASGSQGHRCRATFIFAIKSRSIR